MPRLSLGLGVQNISKVGGGVAPSGIVAANAATLIIGGAGTASGTYTREGADSVLCAGGAYVNSNGSYFYVGPEDFGEYGCSKCFLFGPDTDGQIYGYSPSGPIPPQGVWKIYQSSQEYESAYTNYQLIASNIGSDVNVIPTSNWSEPNLTITAA
jgi:hypothetical protein